MSPSVISRYTLLAVVLSTIAIVGARNILAGLEPVQQALNPFGNWDRAFRSSLPCPSGSTRDEASGICVEICGTGGCRTRPGESYDSRPAGPPRAEGQRMAEEDELLNEPIPLPKCKELILTQEEFDLLPVSPEGDRPTMRPKFGNFPFTTTNFTLSADNRTATMCYPLSPQLLQCPLKRLALDNYVLTSNRSLVNGLTNLTIDVRDYYVLVDGDSRSTYLACNMSVNPKRRLRCNWIDLDRSEFRFLDPDNLTLWLPAINRSVYRPEFRESPTTNESNWSADHVTLCFPLSPAFTWCNYWNLQKPEYQLMDGHRLLSLSHGTSVGPDEYFFGPATGLPAVCNNPIPRSAIFDYFKVLAWLYLLSSVCLLITFIVHLILPSLNYHAKPLLCHIFTMLVMFIALATRKFIVVISPTTCYALFVVTYSAALSAFFWLNVMSFDLWSIFNNLQTTSSFRFLSCCRGNKNRFYLYNIYAWGVPLLLCVFTVVLDTHPSWQDALSLYPGIPNMCWFNDRKSAWLLLYAPMCAVLTGNIILFLWTVWNLRQASKGVEVVNKKLNKQLLFVCFKLFVVMGLCWMAEAIAWTSNTDNTMYWYVPDLINAAQGVIIFIIYICKPQTYKLLRKKFSPQSEGRWTNDFNTSKGNDHRTTSSGITMTSVDRDNSLKSAASVSRTENTSSQKTSEAKL